MGARSGSFLNKKSPGKAVKERMLRRYLQLVDTAIVSCKFA
jgi:hypothetical protein